MAKNPDGSARDEEATRLAFVVEEEGDGGRLDTELTARFAGTSRARIRELLAEGAVRVNGRVARKGLRLQAGDRVVLSRRPEPIDFDPCVDSAPDLALLHEDADLVVIDKPAGVPSHPLRADERGTAVQSLLRRFPEMGSVGYARREAGIVHRLDTGTSGALVAARHPEAFDALRDSLQAGMWDKRYLALCEGRVEADFIDFPFESRGRSSTARISASGEGLEALTEVVDVQVFREYSLVEVRVRSGRRHQVRAHLAAIGHPLVGDTLYGGATVEGFERHFLHASRVIIPALLGRGMSLDIESPLASELAALIATLREVPEKAP